jgi:hypothetical protein
MTTLHDKVLESCVKNTKNELNQLYTLGGLDKNYIEFVEKFYNSIKNNTSEHKNLEKYIRLLKHPPQKFPIGTYVVHTCRGFKDHTTSLVSNNITYENGIIDDYDHKFNQYQLKYDNGSTAGWIEEKYLALFRI